MTFASDRASVEQAIVNYNQKKKEKERIRKYYYSRRPEVRERNRRYIKMRRINSLVQINYDKEHNKYKYRKEYFKKYQSNKKKINLNYALTCRLRNRVYDAIKKYIQQGKIVKAKNHPINYESIIEHLKPFPNNINDYHIDHITPLCSFDLTNPKQFAQAFSPENHQWLPITENRKKGKKITFRNLNLFEEV